MDLIVCIVLMFAALLFTVWSGGQLFFATGFGLALFCMYALRHGNSPRQLGAMLMVGVKKALVVILALLVIGMLTASWMLCGTIPYLVCLGMKLIQPRLFILCAFLLCAAISFLIGTAFGTANTMGVVLMTIARGCGVSPAITAGAILCGIYVGDRCSPMSSSLLLLSTLTGTDHYTNSSRTLRSCLAPLALACLCYLPFSLANPMQGAFSDTAAALGESFCLEPVLLLPVAVMFLLCLCRVPMKKAMLGSIIAACAVALLVQGASPLDLPRVLVLGFHLPEGTLAASLIHGGGISSMASGCLVVLTSCALAGILEGTHATARFESTGREVGLGRYLRTTVTGILTGAIGCNQTMALVLTESIRRGAYPDKDEFLQDLSFGGSLGPVLLPWCITVYIPMQSIGFAGLGYYPYQFWVFLMLLWRALIWAAHARKSAKAA